MTAIQIIIILMLYNIVMNLTPIFSSPVYYYRNDIILIVLYIIQYYPDVFLPLICLSPLLHSPSAGDPEGRGAGAPGSGPHWPGIRGQRSYEVADQ